MNTKGEFPKITLAEISDQVVARTNISREAVTEVLKTFQEIMRECLIAGVAFPLRNIGTITFSKIKPKPDGVRWNGFLKKRVFMLRTKGYFKLRFVAQTELKKAIKRNTSYGEAPSMEELRQWVKDTYGDEKRIKHTMEQWFEENGIKEIE